MDKKILRFHVLGVPHTQVTKEFNTCPYTQLTYNMCKMMADLGHEVYFYGLGDPPCTENIQTITEDVQRATYGKNYNSENFFWVPKRYDDAVYSTFKHNTLRELSSRNKSKDILLTIPGEYHKPIITQANMTVVEPAIGNEHPIAKYRVFCSYAWMHYTYGHQDSPSIYHGKWYDAVIPHYFDPDDFMFDDGGQKQDYIIYIGRVVPEKGVHIASQMCKELGIRFLVAGKAKDQSYLKSLTAEYLGIINKQQRRELLCKAKALVAPSLYIEPFGMPVVEALLSGTPVITTDWGSFPEIVPQGDVGYRCRTMDDFLWAARNIDNIKPARCREYAVANFSMDRCAKAYQEYFMKVQDLHSGGWYKEHPERTDLDWIRRY